MQIVFMSGNCAMCFLALVYSGSCDHRVLGFEE